VEQLVGYSVMTGVDILIVSVKCTSTNPHAMALLWWQHNRYCSDNYY